jgi:hypothetical protein
LTPRGHPSRVLGVANELYKRCKVRSRVAGQSAPCRESHVSPGTCVWCFQPIFVTIHDGEPPTVEPPLVKP